VAFRDDENDVEKGSMGYPCRKLNHKLLNLPPMARLRYRPFYPGS